jgi:hypothetical protein
MESFALALMDLLLFLTTYDVYFITLPGALMLTCHTYIGLHSSSPTSLKSGQTQLRKHKLQN